MIMTVGQQVAINVLVIQKLVLLDLLGVVAGLPKVLAVAVDVIGLM